MEFINWSGVDRGGVYRGGVYRGEGDKPEWGPFLERAALDQ